MCRTTLLFIITSYFDLLHRSECLRLSCIGNADGKESLFLSCWARATVLLSLSLWCIASERQVTSPYWMSCFLNKARHKASHHLQQWNTFKGVLTIFLLRITMCLHNTRLVWLTCMTYHDRMTCDSHLTHC